MRHWTHLQLFMCYAHGRSKIQYPSAKCRHGSLQPYCNVRNRQFLCIHSCIHCHAAKSTLHISHLTHFFRLSCNIPPHNRILTQDLKIFTLRTTSYCWFSLIGQLHFEGTAIPTVPCRWRSLSEIKLLSTMYCIVMKCMCVNVCVCMCVWVLEFTLFANTAAHKHREVLAMLNWLDFTRCQRMQDLEKHVRPNSPDIKLIY